MKRRGKVCVLLLVVFFMLTSVSAVFAAPDDVFLAKMKVTREIVMGTIIEYEVQDLIRGPALLKTPPYRLRVGEALNMFVQEGIAENGRPAYIGLTGIGSRSFKNGFAPVCISKQWSFMDKNGKLLGDYVFEDVGYFSEGLAPCEGKSGCVYIDTKGEILKTPKLYASTESPDGWESVINSGFAEGYALMGSETEGYSSAAILIDKSGEVKAFRKDAIGAGGKFSGGLAPIRISINVWGYVNTRGELAINPDFVKARSFHEGLAAVYAKDKHDNDKWGFIDKKGEFVVEPMYSSVGDFSEGLARVRAGNRTGFVDKSGKVVVNLTFDEARSFSDGLAAVKRGGAWGYINKKGEVVVNYIFKDAGDFVGGLAPVKSKEGSYHASWGYINKTGKFVIQPKYEKADAYSDGLARVVEDDQKRQWGGNARIKYINTSDQAALWFLVPR